MRDDQNGLQIGHRIDLPKVTDERGALTYVEAEDHVPIDFPRVYYIYDAPNDAIRGEHAHGELEQVMVAVSGSFEITLDNGVERLTVSLDDPSEGLYIPPMTWRELRAFSDGAVCLVFASERYDEDDYIDDYNVFLSKINSDN